MIRAELVDPQQASGREAGAKDRWPDSLVFILKQSGDGMFREYKFHFIPEIFRAVPPANATGNFLPVIIFRTERQMGK
jgi:hypothetical protein